MLAKKISVAIAIILSAISCTPQNSIEELQRGWENPPLSARNRVWWHWMNGNITKDGIQKDLQWMKDTRQGGVHNFDAALGTPTIVDKRLIYMDEGWKDAFAYAVKVADSLGLEFTVASAPGWSSTGGPWVSEKDAMKNVWKLFAGVWTIPAFTLINGMEMKAFQPRQKLPRLGLPGVGDGVFLWSRIVQQCRKQILHGS